LDESEPWYGNDGDGAEYYGAPSSPASTQDFNGRGGEASPESLVGRSRKRKSEFEPDVEGDEAWKHEGLLRQIWVGLLPDKIKHMCANIIKKRGRGYSRG
jgi:hypothetical protein